MEFAVVTVKRSLDLAQNFAPVQVGNLHLGLQAIHDDTAEIEIQGPEGVTQLEIPLATAATSQGYTFILRDIGITLPEEKKRRRFRLFGRAEQPQQGVMEADIDVRWGDQALHVADPEKNTAYDFMLVRQYQDISDSPMVYKDQDTLQFGDMRLSISERVEEDSRNYRRERYAPLMVQMDNDDEADDWQVRLNEKYHRKHGYRVKVTSHTWDSDWFQAYGLSIVHGRARDEVDETGSELAEGIAPEAFASADGAEISQTRLDEAKADPHEAILEVNESQNIGQVGVKLLELKPGMARVMFLAPKVKFTTLIHGDIFDLGAWDVSLVGTYGDKAIIRAVPDD